MSRYYFNENPQVVVWREKYEELQKENEELRREAIMAKENVDFFFRRVKKYSQRIKDFDSLPWWKKMFFKFDV